MVKHWRVCACDRAELHQIGLLIDVTEEAAARGKDTSDANVIGAHTPYGWVWCVLDEDDVVVEVFDFSADGRHAVTDLANRTLGMCIMSEICHDDDEWNDVIASRLGVSLCLDDERN